jgi:predicted nucleotidyltransferase component of viral defense system
MKQISVYQSELIDAVLAEKDVGGLTAAILEKDIHVTEILHKLASLQTPPFNLVFCGGTSLAKAHSIIERMSEDIDFKILITDDHGLSRSAINTQLKQLKKQIGNALNDMDFVADTDQFITLNENRYFATAWFYQSHYESDSSLRPHLSLEFTMRKPFFPVELTPIGYLVNQLAELENNSVALSCVAVEETLAEKVLSFLRRYAQLRSEKLSIENWDTALVRHIYDVYCIVSTTPEAQSNAQHHFKALAEQDAKIFSQHTEFAQNPRACLLAALASAEIDTQIQREYQTRLLPLIYGANRPSFSVAFLTFKQSAELLIETL